MFCFKLNKQLGVNFCKIDDLELSFSTTDDPSYFSRYFYLLHESETELYIISNKGSEGFLIPEMKKVDFFLLIRNYIDEDDLKMLINGINKIQDVLVAAEVDPKKLKSKENLIF